MLHEIYRGYPDIKNHESYSRNLSVIRTAVAASSEGTEQVLLMHDLSSDDRIAAFTIGDEIYPFLRFSALSSVFMISEDLKSERLVGSFGLSGGVWTYTDRNKRKLTIQERAPDWELLEKLEMRIAVSYYESEVPTHPILGQLRG